MEEVEQFDDISLDDLAEGPFTSSVPRSLPCLLIACIPSCIELPEGAPRYVVMSYELAHDDGRKSFPLVLVNWGKRMFIRLLLPRSSHRAVPPACEMSLLTLHASALNNFQNTVRSKHSRFDCEVLTIVVCCRSGAYMGGTLER